MPMDPVIAPLDVDLAAIAALSGTGLIVRTGAGTAATRTLTGTANEIAVADGNGVAGNPVLSLPSTLSFTGKTITDLGDVTTADINGGTIDGTTQASGTINGPIAAGGTWTAAATWTLPALTLGGTVSLNGQSFSGDITQNNSAAASVLRVNTADTGVSSGNYAEIQLSDVGIVRTYWRNVRDGSGATVFSYNDHLRIAAAGTERARFNSSGDLSLQSTTASTSTTTGSLINAGGFGNAGAGYFGDTISSTNGTIQTVMSYSGSTGVVGTNSAHSLDIIASGSSRLTVSTTALTLASGISLAMSGASTFTMGTGAATFGGTLAVNGGSLTYSTNLFVTATTSDGSDNQRILLSGGGDVSSDRGAYFYLAGNEFGSSVDGSAVFQIGNATGARFSVGGSSSDSFSVSYAGVVSVASTADGALTVAGKITAKAAVPGSFADLAAVQTYLASILT